MIIRRKEDIDREGKHLPTLFIIVFLIFTGMSYGDENPHSDIFNEYINSPEGNTETSVAKTASPIPLKKKEDHKKSENPDTKKSLQEIPFKDQACVKDSDCTAGVADCMSWEPLNKKYLPELLKHSTSCSASIDPGFQPVTVCAGKMCKTTDKFTDSSWDDWLNERIKP